MKQPNSIRPVSAVIQTFTVQASGEDVPEPMACESCGGSGDLQFVDQTTGERWLRHCPDCDTGRTAARHAWERRFAASQLPRRYADFSFESWDALSSDHKHGKRMARAAASLFVAMSRGQHALLSLEAVYAQSGQVYPDSADHQARSLVLYGPVGTSKTGLLAAIMNALLLHMPVLFLTMEGLFESLNQAIRSGEGDSTLIQTVKRAPVLALDEWTLGRVSEYRRAVLNDILRARFDNDLPTVITTNHVPDELRDENAWGARLLDPVESNALWIPVGGSNLRPKRLVTPNEAF